MIKHHPTSELLQAFVGGDLPASLAAAIAMHNELCPKCQAKITALTEEQAEQWCEQQLTDTLDMTASFADFDIDAMVNEITADDRVDSIRVSPPQMVEINGNEYTLPRALHNMNMGRWSSIGKLSRARFDLNEGEVHSSLLHIQPGGSVPEHTHNGYEITLLLDGNFSDDLGEYVKGDFIVLDGEHKHQPISKDGCLCFTVVNDALHFTQGISKLLNPFGNYVY